MISTHEDDPMWQMMQLPHRMRIKKTHQRKYELHCFTGIEYMEEKI